MIDVQMMIKDYEPPVEDIWTEEEDEIIMLKKAVQSLSPADRIIFLLYRSYEALSSAFKKTYS